MVPSSQPGSETLVVTPRRPRVTPKVSPYFQKANDSTGPAGGGPEASNTVSSDSDEGTNQTQESDSVQEGDAFAMDDEEFAELVNRIAKPPVSRRPEVTPRVIPYFPKPNGLTDSTEIGSYTASSVSDEEAKTKTPPNTVNSSSAEADAQRQGEGRHWALSFYDPKGRCWVKRLE